MKKKIRVFGRRLRGKKLAVKLEGSWRITQRLISEKSRIIVI